MFAKISRGDRMQGLLSYLVGPGRSNEHTEPHLVAGDAALLMWHDDSELDREAAVSIAAHLERPAKVFDVAVSGGHVWHCSLSLRAEEGQLPDQKWQQVAEAFVERMGFVDPSGAKAPARWAAVRHGLSTRGNDHVHLVVNLVREDGTKANVHNDRIRARDLCRELEVEFGLEPLESAGRGRAEVGYQYGEREAAGRRKARAMFERSRREGTETRTWGAVPPEERLRLVAAATTADQPRWALARKVRACSTASLDEAEFVRRLRQHGVLARPRFAAGRSDVVVGYSVAQRPAAGERPIWYGGGQLGKDLTLPRLRVEWESTPEVAQLAAAEWGAAGRGRRPVAPGRETHVVDAVALDQVASELKELRDKLRNVPIGDQEMWAKVARQTSGALAAWSVRTESEAGPLANAADALARSAQTVRAPRRVEPLLPSAAGAAYVLLAASRATGATRYLVLLTQLANLAKAVHDMHQSEAAIRRANAIQAAAQRDLGRVATVLEQYQKNGEALPDAAPWLRDLATAPTRPATPVPDVLAPHREPARAGRPSTTTTRSTDVER